MSFPSKLSSCLLTCPDSAWPSGHAQDTEEAIAFAEVHGVNCMIEKFPFEKANEAIEHMNSGKVRFRGVLEFAK